MRDDLHSSSESTVALDHRIVKLAVIVNPTAGQMGRRKLDGALQRIAAGGWDPVLRHTTARGDAESFARAAINDADMAGVLVAGGDGTINEVINGMAGGSLPLGLLPFGTANVLANEIGIGSDVGRAAAAIVANRTQSIHLGRCNGRLFSMMAGVGFDAHVVAGIKPPLKRLVGKLAYVESSVRQIIRHRPVRYRVITDGAMGEAASVVIANGHFYAGRYIVAPDAKLDRASFEIGRFTRSTRWDALRYSAGMVLGLLPHMSDLVVTRGRSVQIDAAGDAGQGDPIQADGDIIGHLPARIELAAETLSLFSPGS